MAAASATRSAPRPYRQVARAAATDETRRRIVAAFTEAITTRWMDEFTLDDVAVAAGTTRQTLIRLFGGKEDLLRAAAEQLKDGVEIRRALPPRPTAGDIAAAVVADYEASGDMVVRLLAQEDRHPPLAALLCIGRAGHRAWVAEAFATHLAALPPAAREDRLTQLVLATDVYAWKLLRRDFGLPAAQVTGLLADMLTKQTGES